MKMGFTLFEAVITLTILAILLSLSVAYYNSSVEIAYLNSSAEILKTELLNAQQSAISEAVRYFVKFEDKSYIIYREDKQILKEIKLLGKTRIAKTSFKNKYPGENCMFFSISGNPSPGGTVCLQAPNKKCRCVVVSFGYPARIRIGRKKQDCNACQDIKDCSY